MWFMIVVAVAVVVVTWARIIIMQFLHMRLIVDAVTVADATKSTITTTTTVATVGVVLAVDLDVDVATAVVADVVAAVGETVFRFKEVHWTDMLVLLAATTAMVST